MPRLSDQMSIDCSRRPPPFRLPRLLGRASVEVNFRKQGSRDTWVDNDGRPLGRDISLTVVLDGYSAPLTAGNFVDLCKRGFYDGTKVLNEERGFFVQMGDREDDHDTGFVDPASKKRREVPMEILIEGEPSPVYGATLDELGVGDLQPALPVTAYGAMSMEHSLENSNDSSSQFYIFLLDPRSYAARSIGGSALTGSMAAFGYVTEGRQYLAQLEPGDVIRSCHVVSGDENFRATG